MLRAPQLLHLIRRSSSALPQLLLTTPTASATASASTTNPLSSLPDLPSTTAMPPSSSSSSSSQQRLRVLARQFYGDTRPYEDETPAFERAPTSALATHESFDRPPVVPSRAEYERLYRWSIADPNAFWAHMANDFYWRKRWVGAEEAERRAAAAAAEGNAAAAAASSLPPLPPHHRENLDPRKGPVEVTWFEGATTNLSYNCLDRWVAAGRGNALAFIWEGNDYGHERCVSYQQALDETCRVANWLRGQGVKQGDSVTIYLPQVPELPIAMLACARIGAVHSVVFGGFSAEALAQRLADSNSSVLITASGVMRGDKVVPLKKIADAACAIAEREFGHPGVRRVLVVEKSAVPREETSMMMAPAPGNANNAPNAPGRDAWWRDEVSKRPEYCAPVWVDAQHPLFLLYTSGSTGAPKGVVHATGGYMVGAGVSTRALFDLRPGDVYWCSADCGWITGHTYLAYGPLLCGATNVLFGSTPAYPDPGRCWRIIEKYRVRVFYTSPTLVRSLLQHGDGWVTRHDLSSLRVLGTVGEPIGEAAWRWLHDVVGGGRCPIVDTWWQTETGSAMIAPFPHAWETKPGCATLPFFGVEPVLLDAATGRELPSEGPAEGVLAIRRSWPAMARTIKGDHKRWQEAYFSAYPGLYFTGDGARRDADGYYWITGRVDDVINVSGHRLSTSEIESALTSHALCAEAAVVGVPHPVKGESVYAFVTLVDGAPWPPPENLKRELNEVVRSGIGAFAAADVVHWAQAGGLPKTRSGKIMRRLLRKIATGGSMQELGDVSTLADPSVVEQLVAMRGK